MAVLAAGFYCTRCPSGVVTCPWSREMLRLLRLLLIVLLLHAAAFVKFHLCFTCASLVAAAPLPGPVESLAPPPKAIFPSVTGHSYSYLCMVACSFMFVGVVCFFIFRTMVLSRYQVPPT